MAPKGHPFCPPNHVEMYPMNQDLLNKYEIQQFPKKIQHKIPHLLYLAVTRAYFVDMDKFLEKNYAAHFQYCEKILSKLNISPPSRRTKKQHRDLHATLFGQTFTPTIDDDAFMTLTHDLPTTDQHYLSGFDNLIISSIHGRKYDFAIDLWQNNHWDRAIKLLRLYNNHISTVQYIQVLAMLNLSVFGLKKILQIYLFECIKLPFKQSLNSMAVDAEQIEIQVSADENKMQSLMDLLNGCGKSCTTIQLEFEHDLKIRREWNNYKIKYQQEQMDSANNAFNAGKIEIDDDKEEQEEDENENKMEPRADTTFDESTMIRIYGLVLSIEEHVRELQKVSGLLDEVRGVNLKSKPLGK